MCVQGGKRTLGNGSVYNKVEFEFKRAFSKTPSVCATIKTTRSKNIDGNSSVYVEDITTTKCSLIYDSSAQKITCDVCIVAVGTIA